MDKTIISNSAEDTQRIAQNLAENLETNFVALFGELGSGKTTFMQGFAKGLGIKQRIISPTFIIIRKYQISNIKFPISNFYHVDLYRVQTPDDIEGLGLKEIFSDKNSIVAVEWAEKIKNMLPEKRIEIHFENLGEERRRLTFKTYE